MGLPRKVPEKADIVQVKQAPILPELPEKMMPAITELISALGVPRDVLASEEEITCAWADLPRELRKIPENLRGELIARMCVAVSTGLFDSAINYVWNAAIINLRDRLRTFGIAVIASILQKDFEERHLVDLQDSELLELCLKLNLITEEGYFFLDQSRDVRNNFSAAHPALGPINDREFITFLNRCSKYALEESSSPRGVDIGAYITAIKGSRFNDDQRLAWKERLLATHDYQRQLLIGTAHGVYCDPASPENARLNALDICGDLKEILSSRVKSDLVNRHVDYVAKGDEKRHTASQQFFVKLGLIGLLTESERHGLISRAINRLWSTHLAMNNFYNEPPFAERLCELSEQHDIPDVTKPEYVSVVTGCYIGNGYGVCNAAVPHYLKMIKAFSPREIELLVLLSEGDDILSRRTKNGSTKIRYVELLRSHIDAASVPSSASAKYKALIK